MYGPSTSQLIRPTGGGGEEAQVCQGETVAPRYAPRYTCPSGLTPAAGKMSSTGPAGLGAASVPPPGWLTGYPTGVRSAAANTLTGEVHVAPPLEDLL